jgi:hypothetical protein
MRATEWTGRCVAWVALALVSGGLVGCKSLSERYIALEVWKYEKCFGHLPPGFVPPGAAAQPAAQPRICGQNAGCPNACPPANAGCDSCGGSGGGMVMEGGMPTPASISAPGGPGGSPAATSPLPLPGGVTTSRPVVISDEVVVPAS